MTDFYEIETEIRRGRVCQAATFIRARAGRKSVRRGWQRVYRLLVRAWRGEPGTRSPKGGGGDCRAGVHADYAVRDLPQRQARGADAKNGGARARAGEGLFLQLRHRGSGGSAQVFPALDRTNQHCRGDARFPWADVWLAFGDIQQKIPRRLRAARTGISHVAYNNIEALEKAVTSETAAVILEVIQGEGGVYPASTEYIQAARRICDERGALLIVDEVQSGIWAHRQTVRRPALWRHPGLANLCQVAGGRCADGCGADW